MKQAYKITGMTCSNCEEKVTTSLLRVENITAVTVLKEADLAIITTKEPLALDHLQIALGTKYTIDTIKPNEIITETRTWYETYKPILLLFFYITMVTSIMALQNISTSQMNINEIGMKWMNHFMGGFFLAFSFFKFLNLKGFVESYKMYDILAKRIPSWGYFYTFIELSLGFFFLSNIYPLLTNCITFIVMLISLIGVLQTVLNKKKIQCACLGAMFNLPMSTVTIFEDALMIIMSGAMIIALI